ncbi:PAS domain S-box protein [Candidatus Poribacteria bacterium]|nr:PAS domain S-box protein [Candidatus Poribacteria bacterium]
MATKTAKVKGKTNGNGTAKFAEHLKARELENILEHIAAPMVVVDKDLVIRRINPIACKVTGYRAEEVIGKMTCAELGKTPLCGTANCTIRNCMRTGEHIVAETEMTTRDGKKIPISAACSALFDDDGNPVGGMEVIVDRTATVQAQWEMQNILKSVGAPMFVTDKDLKIISINELALKAGGYSREEVVNKMTCADLAKTPLCGTQNCTIKNCMRTGETIVGETEMTTRDGKKVPIAAACSALFDRDGKPYGGMEVIVDRTEAVALLKQTEENRKDLEFGVKAISEVMEAAAEKTMTKRVEVDLKGDLGELKHNVNQCLENLDQALVQVAEAVAQVTSASNQISAGSQSLAEGANEQASSLEEVSSSLEEMSSMTKQNADNANQAKALAESARSSAEKGNEAMRRMKDAIDRIKASSDQTAKIIKTIDEIAFQTNLLALNAAVEAARAGEAGKGFAVVAEEVRNLAQRSAEAAKNTANMIEDSVKNAEGGVRITEEVAKILAEIFDGSGKVNNLIGEIAAASKEQADGIEQVNTAVAQMNKVTQQNAASSEESASAAEELNGQAEELAGMVNSFLLSSNGHAAGEPRAAERHGSGQPKHEKEIHAGASLHGRVHEMLHHGHPAKGPARSSNGKKNGKTQEAASALRPEEVIPLDDGELKEF